jgi:MoxR-like ATPase
MEARKGSTDWQELASSFREVERNIERVVQGKHQKIRLALVSLVAEGHLLIEDVPGVGKTMLAKALARSIDCSFRRIQFTPDLLPTDVTGVNVFNQERGDFEFKPGAIFANIVLGDEINRASPKTQSALLESMEERQVTVDTETYQLGTPFIVIATQNPIEHEGTYRLPEAQVDRFMMKVVIGYPTPDQERMIMDRNTIEEPAIPRKLATPAAILDARAAVRQVHMDEAIKDYIVRIVVATRDPVGPKLADLKPLIAYGVSPRASIYVSLAARAHAFLDGRDYVLPDDIKAVALDVMRHRLIVTYEAEAEEITPEIVIGRVLDNVAVP